ncbi:MAG TPA: ABC transporter substrate-binding protein [Rubrivivax sp.]|nr:ABC transporter substrate-binding protein [Rubrivivax sp.]
MMQRRTVIGAAGLCATWGRAVAQPARKVHRIGVIGSQFKAADIAGPQTQSPAVNALLSGLRELGYVYGESFVTVPRSSEGKPERFPALAAELVAAQVDVIVAPGPALPALKQATATIPIVMTGSGDPVAQGFVQSLARPGGNITGLSLQSLDTVGKRLELLGELVRPTGPIAVLWDRYNLLLWQEAQAAARARGWTLLSLELRDAGELESAFAKARDARASALLVLNSALLDRQAAHIATLAAAQRLPAIYGLRMYVESGGLMAYGPDLDDNWRRAAAFVDKILKGAKPGELPVEQPTKFKLVINLKAAKALGLSLPQSLLLRADEVVR